MQAILNPIKAVLNFVVGLLGGPSMLKFLFRRLISALPVLFAVMAVTFGLSQALPGGPFDAVNQREMPEHIKRQLEQRYGLNKPVFFNGLGDGKAPDTAWGKQYAIVAGYELAFEADDEGKPILDDEGRVVFVDPPTPLLYATDENGNIRLKDGELPQLYVPKDNLPYDKSVLDYIDMENGQRVFRNEPSTNYVTTVTYPELDNTGFSIFREYTLVRWDNDKRDYIEYQEKPYTAWAKENEEYALDIAHTSYLLTASFAGLPTSNLMVTSEYSVTPSISYSVDFLESYVEDCQLYGNFPGWSIIAKRDKCEAIGGSGTGEDSRIFSEVTTVWQIDMLDTQFWGYMWNILQLDFGPSLNIARINENVMVMDEIERRLPVSMQLGLIAVAFGFTLGVPLGVLAALYHNKPIDYIATFFAVMGQSVPSMVLGPIMIIIFAVELDILPEPNKLVWQGSLFNRLTDPEFLGVLVMPVLALGTGMSAGIARLTRASLLQVMREDYIRTARAKGLRERTVIYLHALKNSLIPVATILGPLLAGVLTGTFIVELIFLIPGLGDAFVVSVASRDYTTIMAVTLLYSSFLIAGNILVDVIYTWLDPRIRFD